MSTESAFADVLDANHEYAAGFSGAGIPGKAGKGLAIVTCGLLVALVRR